MRLIHLILILGLSTCIQAQTRTYKVRKQQKEFKILKEALLDVTGDPFLYSSKEELTAIFDSVQHELNQPKTARELFQAYSFLAGSIKCGHTTVMPNGALLRDYLVYSQSLPILITVRDGRLYSDRAFGRDPRIEEGDEIRFINGASSQNMLDSMRKYFSSDGDNTTFKDQFFAEFFNFYHFVTFGSSDSFEVVFIYENQVLDTAMVASEDADFRAFKRTYRNSAFINYGRSERSFGKLKSNRNSNALVWSIPSFANASGSSYQRFVDSRIRAINNSKMDYLILDLRGNLGGVVQKYLMGYFLPGQEFIAEMHLRSTNKPKYHRRYKKWNASWIKYRAHAALERAHVEDKYGTVGTYYWIQEQADEDRCQKKLVVLVDGMTFSAGSNAAANLKEKAGAVIIGEESGGSYRGGNTGQLLLKMPKTKFRVVVNPVHYSNNVNLEMGSGGLIPDVVVERGFNERRDDAVLEAAFDYIEKASSGLEMKENSH